MPAPIERKLSIGDEYRMLLNKCISIHTSSTDIVDLFIAVLGNHPHDHYHRIGGTVMSEGINPYYMVPYNI